MKRMNCLQYCVSSGCQEEETFRCLCCLQVVKRIAVAYVIVLSKEYELDARYLYCTVKGLIYGTRYHT